MNIEDVLTLRDESAFRRALHDNLPRWLESFLADIAKRSWRKPGNGEIYQQGAFARYMRAAFVGIRPRGADNVASGTWCLPCGLTAAAAWKLFREHLTVLNVEDLTERFVGTVALLATAPTVRPRFDPRSVASTKWSRKKHLKELNTAGRSHGPSGEAIDTRLQGFNKVRFAERLAKAHHKGLHQVRVFLADLLQLRERLADLPDVDFQELFEAMKAIESAVDAAKASIRHLRRTTPEEDLIAQARAERAEVKRFKKATRSLNRQARNSARRAALKAARNAKPAEPPAPADNVVDFDVIRRSKAEKREARMVRTWCGGEDVVEHTGPRNSRPHYTCMKSQRGLPLRRAA